MKGEAEMTRSEILQIAKPILFNTEMVRAILDGRKTVTRRVIKPQPTNPRWNNVGWVGWDDGHGYRMRAPYQPGDYLYVRESFVPNYFCSAVVNYRDGELRGNRNAYKADYYKEKIGDVVPEPKWTPSIHMPKEAARIFLRVTDVKVERLSDMDYMDAIYEGIEPQLGEDGYPGYNPMIDFIDLWDSTIQPKDRDKYGWAANPYVFVIEFERVEVEQ